NLEPNLWLRRVGYDWAFATITPALLETAQFFQITIFNQDRVRSPTVREGRSRKLASLTVGLPTQALRIRNAPKIKISKSVLVILIAIGLARVFVPLLYPNECFAPVVWLSFILLVDPINAMLGLPAITSDLALGKCSRLLSLLT